MNKEEAQELLNSTECFEISLTQDVIDSRDIQERINALKNAKEHKLLSEDEKRELKQLESFKEQCEDSNGDSFEYGQIIVHENYFDKYAEEKAYEFGYIEKNSPLASCIDWDEWAELMKDDYLEVEYNEETYYVY